MSNNSQQDIMGINQVVEKITSGLGELTIFIVIDSFVYLFVFFVVRYFCLNKFKLSKKKSSALGKVFALLIFTGIILLFAPGLKILNP